MHYWFSGGYLIVIRLVKSAGWNKIKKTTLGWSFLSINRISKTIRIQALQYHQHQLLTNHR